MVFDHAERQCCGRQHIPLQARVGLFHENLIEAAALMEAHIEEPLSLDEIAALVGVSRRQIERLFKRYVGQVPTKYYLDLSTLKDEEFGKSVGADAYCRVAGTLVIACRT